MFSEQTVDKQKEEIEHPEELLQPDTSSDLTIALKIDLPDNTGPTAEIPGIAELDGYAFECEVGSENFAGKVDLFSAKLSHRIF